LIMIEENALSLAIRCAPSPISSSSLSSFPPSRSAVFCHFRPCFGSYNSVTVMASIDLEGIRSHVVSQQQYVIVWTALLYWDWLSLLPMEHKYIWKARWTWLKLIFLLNRYGVLLWNFFSMAMIFATVSKGVYPSLALTDCIVED